VDGINGRHLENVAQAGRKCVDATDHGKGVVDSRRHGAETDFHDLRNGKLGVLTHGAAVTDDHGFIENIEKARRRLGGRGFCVESFGVSDGRAFQNEVAGTKDELDEDASLSSSFRKDVEIDALEVAAARCGERNQRGSRQRGDGRERAFVRIAKSVEDADYVDADVQEDSVDLNKNGDIVHEVDQCADATESKEETGPGRNLGNEIGAHRERSKRKEA
jgi:hypothetical protein